MSVGERKKLNLILACTITWYTNACYAMISVTKVYAFVDFVAIARRDTTKLDSVKWHRFQKASNIH